MTEEERTEYQRQTRIRFALLPPDKFPRIIEAAGPLTDCKDPDAHYKLGIDMFISGVQALAA